MLTELKLSNFIHFKDKQTFVFEKGLNILLGTNHTGKTSVFEAIRRCMSISQNGGLSNPHDADKFSYAACKFEGDGHTVYSSIIRVVIFDETVTLKIAQYQENTTDDAVEYGIDIVGPVGRDVSNGELGAGTKSDEDTCYRLLQILRADEDTDLEDIVMEYLQNVGPEKVKYFLKNTPKEKKNTTCEKLLKKFVDEEAVIIFPFRSFSPYQWTKSKREMKYESGDTLDEITMKKEIVYWYLNPETKGISKETRRLEEKYFDLITGNSGFKFQRVGKRVGVTNVHFSRRNPSTNLLQIPEGIYEAKSAAIVLAVQQFRTICLDDAERGMHPQMIERLRDLVLQDIDDKVVLVITHHTAFLAPWNISRTFFFQRHMDADGYRFAVKPLSNLDTTGGKSPQDTSGGKGPHIITSGQFANLFFAERICWVEGKTEYLFMTALKYEFLRKGSSLLEMYCSNVDEQRKRFRDFLSTLHIVSMDGEAAKVFFRSISQSLELTHFFILDFDALLRNLPKLKGEKDTPPKTPKDIVSNFCTKFPLNIDNGQIETIDTLDAVANTLQGHGVFVWKLTDTSDMDKNDMSTGAIEHAVDRMCQSNPKGPELNTFLIERNMNLTKKKGKFEKLFKNADTKNGDITAVVRQLLTLSHTEHSYDFHRLVSFLKQMSADRTQQASLATGDSCEQSGKKRKFQQPCVATGDSCKQAVKKRKLSETQPNQLEDQ